MKKIIAREFLILIGAISLFFLVNASVALYQYYIKQKAYSKAAQIDQLIAEKQQISSNRRKVYDLKIERQSRLLSSFTLAIYKHSPLNFKNPAEAFNQLSQLAKSSLFEKELKMIIRQPEGITIPKGFLFHTFQQFESEETKSLNDGKRYFYIPTDEARTLTDLNPSLRVTEIVTDLSQLDWSSLGKAEPVMDYYLISIEKLKSYINGAIINSDDLKQYKISEQEQAIIQTLSSQKVSWLNKILSRDQFKEILLITAVIIVVIGFLIRYLAYAIRWSIRVIRTNNSATALNTDSVNSAKYEKHEIRR